MRPPYSVGERRMALKCVYRFGMGYTSKLMGIHRSTLWRWKHQGIENRQRKLRQESELFQRTKEPLLKLVQSNCFSSGNDLVRGLRVIYDITIGRKTVYKFLKQLKYTRKRTLSRGKPKGNIDDIRLKFVDDFKKAVESGKVLVSIDECGFNEKTHPIYGYCKIGKRLLVQSRGSWVHHSLLLAIFSDGRREFMIKQGAIKKSDFVAFVESLNIGNNHVVLLDNASIHKNIDLRASKNASLLYTPPYSPEFNPIELSFGTIKHDFRARNIGLDVNVPETVRQCVFSYPTNQAIACFKHVRDTFVNRYDSSLFDTV